MNGSWVKSSVIYHRSGVFSQICHLAHLDTISGLGTRCSRYRHILEEDSLYSRIVEFSSLLIIVITFLSLYKVNINFIARGVVDCVDVSIGFLFRRVCISLDASLRVAMICKLMQIYIDSPLDSCCLRGKATKSLEFILSLRSLLLGAAAALIRSNYETLRRWGFSLVLLESSIGMHHAY